MSSAEQGKTRREGPVEGEPVAPVTPESGTHAVTLAERIDGEAEILRRSYENSPCEIAGRMIPWRLKAIAAEVRRVEAEVLAATKYLRRGWEHPYKLREAAVKTADALEEAEAKLARFEARETARLSAVAAGYCGRCGMAFERCRCAGEQLPASRSTRR